MSNAFKLLLSSLIAIAILSGTGTSKAATISEVKMQKDEIAGESFAQICIYASESKREGMCAQDTANGTQVYFAFDKAVLFDFNPYAGLIQHIDLRMETASRGVVIEKFIVVPAVQSRGAFLRPENVSGFLKSLSDAKRIVARIPMADGTVRTIKMEFPKGNAYKEAVAVK